jgi:hypothetical protein
MHFMPDGPNSRRNRADPCSEAAWISRHQVKCGLELTKLSDHTSDDKRPESVRLSAAMLKIALGDIAETLATKFVPKSRGSDPRIIFEHVRRDHLEVNDNENS